MKGRRKKDLNAEEESAPSLPPPPIGRLPWLLYDRSKPYPNHTFFSLKPEVQPINIYRQIISALSRKEDLNAEEPPPPPPIGRFPWLVYDRSKRYQNQAFFSPIPEVRPINQRISALKRKKVFSCSYGYLILYDCTKKLLSLFNCTTFHTTPLPKLHLKPTNTIDSCVLCSSPKSPNCKVLVFLENCQSLMCCRIRSNRWSEIRYGNQLRDAIDLLRPRQRRFHGRNWERWYDVRSIPYMCFCDPVICRGKIYANLRISSYKYPELWSIEMVEEEEVVLTLSRLDSSRLKDEFVVESDGELYCLSVHLGKTRDSSVHLGKTGDSLEVETRKLSRDGMVWERVQSLKNQSFFICQDYCVFCPTPGLDCTLFTMAEDLSLYTYNLEEDSFSVSHPFGTSFGTIQNHPFWMIPEVLIRKEEEDCSSREARLLDFKVEDDEEKNLLTDLPLDALNEVTRHLNPHDFLSFRSLSRSCRLAAPLANWRKSTDLSSFPLHMFAVKFRSLYRFVHPLQNRAQSYLITIPDCLQDAKIHYSNHGWILVTTRRSDSMLLHLYNPFTKDIHSYEGPRIEPKVLFFISKPSSSSTCFFIHLASYGAYITNTTGSTFSRWTSLEFVGHRSFVGDSSPSPALFQKAFYFLNKYGELVRLSKERNYIRAEHLTRPFTPCRAYHQSFLVECCGELLSVFVGHMGKCIHVYKLDWSKDVWRTLVWTNVTSLKGHALFLSQASSFSEVASPGMDNRIYFPRFRDGGALYYALDRAEWKIVGSEETLCDFSGTEFQLHSCWIKPSWS